MAVRRLLHPVRFSIVLAAVLAAACSRPPARGALAVTDDWGRRIALAAPARRIVSLAPATTELVFALGLGDRLVGRTHWCDFPAAALAVPDLGNGIGPNVEAVAALHPDLVLLYASAANRPALGRFEALGIPTAVLRTDLTNDLRRAARLIAEAAGDSASAGTLLASFDRGLDAERARSAAGASSRVRVYVDVESNPPITVGAGSYLSEILAAAGAANVFADIPQPSAPVSLETIVARDPDVILVLTSDTSRTLDLASRPGWRSVPAVRAHRVLAVDGSLYGRPSPRMPQAVRDLAARLAALGPRR